MIYIFIGIFVISTIGLFMGLIYPPLIIRWKERPSRFHVFGLFIPLIAISFIMIVLSPPPIVKDNKIFKELILSQTKNTMDKAAPMEVVELSMEEPKVRKKEIQEIVPEIQIPVLTRDKDKEEKFFNQDYQGVVNRLRKILREYRITLYRGGFIDYKTHRVITFTTSTAHEISMKITDKRQLQSLYTIVEKGTEEENLKSIMTSMLCSVNSTELTLEECSMGTNELLRNRDKSEIKQIDIANIRNIFVKDRYYKLMPK